MYPLRPTCPQLKRSNWHKTVVRPKLLLTESAGFPQCKQRIHPDLNIYYYSLTPMILNSGQHTQPDPQSCRVRRPEGRRGRAQKETTLSRDQNKTEQCDALSWQNDPLPTQTQKKHPASNVAAESAPAHAMLRKPVTTTPNSKQHSAGKDWRHAGGAGDVQSATVFQHLLFRLQEVAARRGLEYVLLASWFLPWWHLPIFEPCRLYWPDSNLMGVRCVFYAFPAEAVVDWRNHPCGDENRDELDVPMADYRPPAKCHCHTNAERLSWRDVQNCRQNAHRAKWNDLSPGPRGTRCVVNPNSRSIRWKQPPGWKGRRSRLCYICNWKGRSRVLAVRAVCLPDCSDNIEAEILACQYLVDELATVTSARIPLGETTLWTQNALHKNKARLMGTWNYVTQLFKSQ